MMNLHSVFFISVFSPNEFFFLKNTHSDKRHTKLTVVYHRDLFAIWKKWYDRELIFPRYLVYIYIFHQINQTEALVHWAQQTKSISFDVTHNFFPYYCSITKKCSPFTCTYVHCAYGILSYIYILYIEMRSRTFMHTHERQIIIIMIFIYIYTVSPLNLISIYFFFLFIYSWTLWIFFYFVLISIHLTYTHHRKRKRHNFFSLVDVYTYVVCTVHFAFSRSLAPYRSIEFFLIFVLLEKISAGKKGKISIFFK